MLPTQYTCAICHKPVFAHDEDDLEAMSDELEMHEEVVCWNCLEADLVRLLDNIVHIIKENERE